jgi:hypothetical protein
MMDVHIPAPPVLSHTLWKRRPGGARLGAAGGNAEGGTVKDRILHALTSWSGFLRLSSVYAPEEFTTLVFDGFQTNQLQEVITSIL